MVKSLKRYNLSPHQPFLLMVLVVILAQSCSRQHADNPANIPPSEITNSTWQMFYLWRTSVNYIEAIPVNWSFTLTTDQHFTFKLNGISSSGTYTWTQVDSVNARIKFSISNWNSAIEDSSYNNRLKEVLLDIDRCAYLRPPNLLITPAAPFPATQELGFIGNKGGFYVYQ